MNMSWVIYDFSHMIICLLWFCHGFSKGEIVRTYVFHMLRTYVIILCNWLIIWQNALYLYLGRLRMFKYFKKPRFKIKCWSFQVCSRNQANNANSLKLDSCSTPPIYRGLRILEFKYDFLGNCEYVFGPSFLLTLDI